MTIPAIKSALSIETVLAHYGLKASAKGAMKCPFHPDGKASMKIYPETNTAFCFSGSCEVQSVDVIDFIMRMEKGTKREAILKAKELVGNPIVTLPSAKPAAPELDLAAIYEESIERMQTNASGRDYCAARGLNPDELGVGYRSRKSKERWGRGCIVFPLVDEGCKIRGLYGRAVKGGGHYYTADRAGLYPEYPDNTTGRLLLTESVIDAACIMGVMDVFSILALYGTNGLTAEHRREIQTLPELREVILALDGDAAGRKATTTLATELHALRPGLTVSTLALPEGEDINGLWVSHADEEAGWLQELYAARKVITAPDSSSPQVTAQPKKEAMISPPTLDTSNKNNLVYQTTTATYEVKGGVRTAPKDLDSLKVTLAIRAAAPPLGAGGHSRQKLDLYEDKQIHHLSRLVELEYLHKTGFANHGFRYKIAHWDDMEATRGRIKTELLEQVEDL